MLTVPLRSSTESGQSAARTLRANQRTNRERGGNNRLSSGSVSIHVVHVSYGPVARGANHSRYFTVQTVARDTPPTTKLTPAICPLLLMAFAIELALS
jgi:hypothetical protein